MENTQLLAVDLGASGGKCFTGTFRDGAFALDEIHRFAHEGIPFFIEDRMGVVTERTHWDDTAIYANILEGLRTYRREVSDTLDGIGIDTWGADGAFFSGDGEMVGKLYCYRDHRLDGMIDKVKACIEPDRMYAMTGIHFQPFNVSNQLHWFVRNRPELLVEGVHYLPAPSLFYYYLCGARKVDSAWASVTQLMDAKTRAWSTDVLDALDIPMGILPEIVEPGSKLGKLHSPLARHVGLNRAEMIAVGSHDTACAFAAAPVDDPAEALIISSGTWSLVGRLVPEPITSTAAMAANISNEGGIGNTRFLKNCMGGWLTQELRRVWRNADGREMSWRELDELTLAAPPFAALIDPDDATFYNPENMEIAMADFCRRTHQAVPADRGSLLRTVYESLALKYRMVNRQIGAICGRDSRAVHIVGGGCKNTLLNQFTANALRLPVIAGPEEATAVGNLMTQAMGLGVLENLRAAQPLIRAAFPIATFQPEDPAAWDAAYERFQAICA